MHKLTLGQELGFYPLTLTEKFEQSAVMTLKLETFAERKKDWRVRQGQPPLYRRLLSTEKVRQIRHLHRQGQSYREIADLLSISRSTAHKAANLIKPYNAPEFADGF